MVAARDVWEIRGKKLHVKDQKVLNDDSVDSASCSEVWLSLDSETFGQGIGEHDEVQHKADDLQEMHGGLLEWEMSGSVEGRKREEEDSLV